MLRGGRIYSVDVYVVVLHSWMFDMPEYTQLFIFRPALGQCKELISTIGPET